ncbi:MAG: hypothetical protein K5668_05555 [Lachnospiraceae bacterium]|nr:hypothetical protein [Lachnospiraceae bacterium]
MTEGKTGDNGSKSATLALLIFIPVIGTGGTAIVSYFRFFSVQEVIMNTVVAAALCIVAEIPLKKMAIDSEGAVYFVYSYLCGLLMAVLSGFSYEFILPLSGPAVLIGLLGGPVSGISALLLFCGISTIVLYESGLYFFFMFFTGFLLILLFTLDRDISIPSVIFTAFFIGAVTFYACCILSERKLSPENVVFPLIGIVLDFIIILVMSPKIYENVIDREENFINSILDPEYELLQRLKNENRPEYDKMIHSVHLINILMEKMGLERIKLNGTGYYCRIGVLRGENDNVAEKSLSMLHEREFPEEILEGILEYYAYKGRRLSRESGVVLISNRLIFRIYEEKALHPETKIDFNQLVTDIMKDFTGERRVLQSDLSLNDLNIISDTMRKQEFYYDFIL